MQHLHAHTHTHLPLLAGVHLGEIPEASETYNVIGNMNEFGLVIGETTYGGVAALQHQTGAILDYGNLEWLALQVRDVLVNEPQSVAALADAAKSLPEVVW